MPLQVQDQELVVAIFPRILTIDMDTMLCPIFFPANCKAVEGFDWEHAGCSEVLVKAQKLSDKYQEENHRNEEWFGVAKVVLLKVDVSATSPLEVVRSVRQPTILVAATSYDSCQKARKIFDGWGFRMVAANNVETAMKMLNRFPEISMTLVDNLADDCRVEHGPDLIRKLRQKKLGGVLVAHSCIKEVNDRLLEAGCSELVTKFDLEGSLNQLIPLLFAE